MEFNHDPKPLEDLWQSAEKKVEMSDSMKFQFVPLLEWQ